MPSSPPVPTNRKVLILAYPQVSLLDLTGPLEALCSVALASPDKKGEAYDCTVVSVDGGPVMTADGVTLLTAPVSDFNVTLIDTIIVPGAFTVEAVLADPRNVAWLKAHAGLAGRICSVCAGSFILAEAGLLDGRRATTHWMHCDRLAVDYPTTQVEADAIFVRDGKIWCSAGVTTGIDLALALVEEDFGRDVAMQIARILVVFLRRSGGQSQYSSLLRAQAQSRCDRFDTLDDWISQNLAGDLSVERMAERASMSPRNFARVYARERGQTPARAVSRLRLEAARNLLEQTNEQVSEIAVRCGFEREAALRSVFRRELGVSPSEYRDHFSLFRSAR